MEREEEKCRAGAELTSASSGETAPPPPRDTGHPLACRPVTSELPQIYSCVTLGTVRIAGFPDYVASDRVTVTTPWPATAGNAHLPLTKANPLHE